MPLGFKRTQFIQIDEQNFDKGLNELLAALKSSMTTVPLKDDLQEQISYYRRLLLSSTEQREIQRIKFDLSILEQKHKNSFELSQLLWTVRRISNPHEVQATNEPRYERRLSLLAQVAIAVFVAACAYALARLTGII